MNLLMRLRPNGRPNSPGSAAADLAAWREQILQATLVFMAVLAAIGYVPGMIAAIRSELWIIAVADTVVWVGVIWLAAARGLPYHVRAIAFASLWYLLALVLLWTTGPQGGGALWLMAFPVAIAVFMGLRAALLALGLALLTTIGFGVVIQLTSDGSASEIPVAEYGLAAWSATGGSVLLLGGVLALSVAYLVHGMERSLTEVHRSRAEVAEGKSRLEEEMAERSRLHEELLQSQKMEALGTLAGGVAHDFNNLLVPILLRARALQDRAMGEEVMGEEGPRGPAARTGAEADDQEALAEIVQAATRARDLIRRILAFSRRSPEETAPVEVELIVREVGSLLRTTTSARIEIRWELGAGGAHIMANAGELQQVLLNLGTNAYLATRDEGGTVTLETRRDPATQEVVIRVGDDGVGIPPEIRNRIFDPFFTTRGPGEGTGLGLAIVRRLVTGTGGTLRVESESGVGTTVEIRYPEHQMSGSWEGTELAADDGAGAPRPDRDLTILLVDDEPAVLRATAHILRRLGYRVVELASPTEALNRVEGAPGEGVDLLLTDQAMPKLSGLELIRQVRRVRPRIPVVLASGHLDARALETVEELPGVVVLDKPFEQRDLERVIREALESGGVA